MRLTHLTRASQVAPIRRAGIKPSPRGDQPAGVFAMPVLPNYYASHQWLRELKRHQAAPLVAIDFVIPDDEFVFAGHYSSELMPYTVAEAAGVMLSAPDPRGYELVVPRKVQANEIKRTRPVSRVVGWRYWPEAHGRPPCSCDFCQRGLYGAARLRALD